ncbi:MAG: DUF2723 domain-containing protein [Acidobacteriota bacterium]
MSTVVDATGRQVRHAPLLSDASLMLVAVAAVLAAHLAWITARYSFDAVAFAGLVHHAVYGDFVSLWNEYHILYMPLAYGVLRILKALGWTPDALMVMQLLNAATTSLYLCLFARLLRDRTRNTGVSVAFMLFLGVTFAVWYYSTDPEVYPPAILFLLLTFGSALRALHTGSSWAAVMAAVFAGVAFGFHVTSILIVPFIVMALILDRAPRQPWTRCAAHCGVFVAVFAVVSLAPYVLLYHGVFGSGVVTGLAELLERAVYQKAWGGHRWFMGSGFRPDLELMGLLRGVAADPEERSVGMVAVVWAIRSAFLAMIAVALARARAMWRRHRWAVFIAVGWLMSSFIFFSSMNVGNLKFIGFQLVPLLVLCALAFSTLGGQRVSAAAVAFLAILLAFTNLLAAIRPYSKIETNEDYRKSAFVRDHTNPEDLVVQMGGGANIAQKVYLPYFAARRGLILDFAFRDQSVAPAEALRRLAARFDSCWAAGGAVFVFSDVLEDDGLMRELWGRSGVPPEQLRSFFARYRPELHEALDDQFRLYRLTPPVLDAPEASLVP